MNTCESIKENFLNTFQSLSKKQQKIWQYIQWYAQNYRQVFPSHTTIAKAIGCCRDTVIKTIKKFNQSGWLGTIKRCFRSSLYFIAEELIDLNTKKSETFRKIPNNRKPKIIKSTESTTTISSANPTLYKTKLKEINVRNTLNQTKIDQPKVVQQKNCQEVKHILENIGIKGKDLWCLARYSLLVIAKAVEDYKTRKASGPIRNLAAWLTNRCKAYS